jgi:hypothetical protein
MRAGLYILMFLLVVSCQSKQEGNAMSSFVDEYFDALFEWSPSTATAIGFHQYDSKIEDFSQAAISRRIDRLKQLESGLMRARTGKLTVDEEIDADIIGSQIKAELLDIETLQTWRHNPMNYVGLPGGTIDGLMKRNFEPPAERLRSMVSRLEGVPALMKAMKENIQNPPHEFTDLAFRMAHGSVGFFKDTVAMWAKDAAGNDTALLQEFNSANEAAASSLDDAATWLEKTLLPNSKGDYAIGAEYFSKKLLYEEMVDTPLDRLLAIGEANLEKDYAAFIETARKIDASKSPMAAMKSLSDDHPTEASLIPDAKKTVEGIIRFINDKNIVTIPSDVRPSITETPPYARSGTFASMDTPGPYETKATEAFYYVTPPEKDWEGKHKDEHLRAFNPPVMTIITIHEAYPGHYVQFLNAKQFPTKTRKILYCSSNVEGWAHYTEQMMLEEGFAEGDPRMRLAQLEEALLRDARYVVGIKLHTAGWTVEQGAKFFEEKAFQEPANAYEEARRGAYNPTYLYYTLGKLQIYKLRDDYQKAKGSSHSFELFHDEFLKQGGVPIKIIRRILLPGDNGDTL